jgi:hypothetical protein
MTSNSFFLRHKMPLAFGLAGLALAAVLVDAFLFDGAVVKKVTGAPQTQQKPASAAASGAASGAAVAANGAAAPAPGTSSTNATNAIFSASPPTAAAAPPASQTQPKEEPQNNLIITPASKRKTPPKRQLAETPVTAVPLDGQTQGRDAVSGTRVSRVPMHNIRGTQMGGAGAAAQKEEVKPSGTGKTMLSLYEASQRKRDTKSGQPAVSFRISFGDDTQAGRAPKDAAGAREKEGFSPVGNSAAAGRAVAVKREAPAPRKKGDGLERVREEDIPFAPYGRHIKCELVNPIESFYPETPVVARVIEAVYWRGKMIVPAGAELHGTAQPSKVRDRLLTGREWRLILPAMGDDKPAGTELRVRGIALNREVNPTETRYGVMDGTGGIAGTVIETKDLEEIKMFIATFLSSYAQGLQTVRDVGSSGAVAPDATPRNAAMQGVSKVLDRYAERILEEIERNGSFLRVSGGTTFYLYVQQTLTPVTADIPLPPEIQANHDIVLEETRKSTAIRNIQKSAEPNMLDEAMQQMKGIQAKMDAVRTPETTPAPAGGG